MNVSDIADALLELPEDYQIDEFLDDIIGGFKGAVDVLAGGQANKYQPPPYSRVAPRGPAKASDPARTTFSRENARGETGTGSYKGRGLLGGAWAGHEANRQRLRDKGVKFRPLTGDLGKYETPRFRKKAQPETPKTQTHKRAKDIPMQKRTFTHHAGGVERTDLYKQRHPDSKKEDPKSTQNSADPNNWWDEIHKRNLERGGK